MRVTTLVNNLRVLGDTIDDGRIVRKTLHVVPKRYSQVEIAIKTLLDLDNLSLEELTGRLRTVEDRLNEEEAAAGASLLYTKEEWEARCGHRSPGDGSSSGVSQLAPMTGIGRRRGQRPWTPERQGRRCSPRRRAHSLPRLPR